jgi:hypothetical protein
MNGQTATATLPVTVSNAVTALTAAFTAPASGATVSGTTTVGFASSGAIGSSTFSLALNGTVLSTQTVTGTTASSAWDTTTVTNGPWTLTLTVTDGGGRTATATLPVTVDNIPPLTASFTAPSADATVSGTTTVGLASSGAIGSSTFSLSVDSTALSTQTVTGTTASYDWNTMTIATGTRTLTLQVTDGAGRTAMATRTVTVSNTPSFTAWFTSPAPEATVRGNQTVGMATTATSGQTKTFTLSVDGKVLTTKTLTGTATSYAWNTKKVANGRHVLTLTVSMDGQTATATVSVTVNNAVGSGK